jgi:hypothetical protein
MDNPLVVVETKKLWLLRLILGDPGAHLKGSWHTLYYKLFGGGSSKNLST